MGGVTTKTKMLLDNIYNNTKVGYHYVVKKIRCVKDTRVKTRVQGREKNK